MKNDNTKIIELKWLKGVKMQNIESTFLIRCIGIAILACSVAVVIKVIAPIGLIH